MKRIALLIISMVCFIAGQGFCSTEWPNEPAGSANVFDCPFEGNLCGMQDVWKNTVFTVDPTTQTGGTNQVLDNYLGANSTSGVGQQVFYLPGQPREIYVGTWWKTNPEFEANTGSIANKLLFISGNGNNNFLNWPDPRDDGFGNLIWCNQSVQDNSHVIGPAGFVPNISAAGNIRIGSGWHRIEIYQKASTTGVSRDGTIRMWIDGTLTTNYVNLNLSPDGFTDVQYNHTWDGTWAYDCAHRDCGRTWHHYWDHLRVSIPNCGAGGCAVAPFVKIRSTLLPPTVGRLYTATLTAEGGTPPYTWLIEGTLPAGLELNANVISGRPTCGGPSKFTIRVVDSSKPALTDAQPYDRFITSGAACTSISADVAAGANAAQFVAKSVGGKLTFNLAQTSHGNYHVSIFDLGGKKVFEHKASAGGQKEMRIEAALKNGVYFAKFVQGREISKVRFNVMN